MSNILCSSVTYEGRRRNLSLDFLFLGTPTRDVMKASPTRTSLVRIETSEMSWETPKQPAGNFHHAFNETEKISVSLISINYYIPCVQT